MSYEGKRTEHSEKKSLMQRYRAYLSQLSRRELILRRVLIVLSAIAVVILLAAAAVTQIVKAPDVPDDPGAADTGTTDGGELGDAPATAAGRKEGTYTFLVCGRDTGGGGNTDTMLLVTFDTENGSINAMSLPRDTMVNVSWRTKKLNSVYNGLGIDGLKEHVGKLTGVTPDFYVIVEWEAVGKLVDAIGGVEFDVPYNMDYDDPVQDLHIHQEAGLRLLDGEDAMQVIRWRKNNSNSVYGYHGGIGDTGRIQLQQDFLMAVAKECLKLENLVNIQRFATIFQENVETDLTFGNLLWFGQQALYLDAEEDVQFHTLPANMNGSYDSRSYVFPYPDEIVEMVNQYLNPYLREIRESDLEIMVLNSNGTLSVTNGTLADPSVGRTQTPAAQPEPEPSAEPEPSPTPAESTQPAPQESTQPQESQDPAPEESASAQPTDSPLPETTIQPEESGTAQQPAA